MIKKRLRKKFRVGEFKQLGFSITFYHKNEEAIDKFIEYLEANKMCCGGGGTDIKSTFFVMPVGKRNTLSYDDQRKLIVFTKSIPGVTFIIHLDLVDAWYNDAEVYMKKLEKMETAYENLEGVSDIAVTC